MNNKILLAIIGILILVGVGIVLTLRGQKPETQQNQTTQQTTPSPAQAADQEVQQLITVTKSGFDPQTIKIKPKTRVIWLNKSGGIVTVNSSEHPTHQDYIPLNLGQFRDAFSVQLVFDKSGTYKYHNHLNPNQTGTIVVE